MKNWITGVRLAFSTIVALVAMQAHSARTVVWSDCYNLTREHCPAEFVIEGNSPIPGFVQSYYQRDSFGNSSSLDKFGRHFLGMEPGQTASLKISFTTWVGGTSFNFRFVSYADSLTCYSSGAEADYLSNYGTHRFFMTTTPKGLREVWDKIDSSQSWGASYSSKTTLKMKVVCRSGYSEGSYLYDIYLGDTLRTTIRGTTTATSYTGRSLGRCGVVLLTSADYGSISDHSDSISYGIGGWLTWTADGEVEDETYTVSYQHGKYGSAGTPQTATKTKDVPLTLLGAIFTRTAYTQTGWSTFSSGSVKSYDLNGTYTNNADLTLYPYWSGDPIKLKFNANGGTVSPEYKYVNLDSSFGELPTPTRDDDDEYTYTFLGWYTAASGGNQVSPTTTMTLNSAKTVYAHWSASPKPVISYYTVTYKPGAYGAGSQQSDTKTENVALTLPGAIFMREGYTQAGWSTSDGGAKAYDLGASYAANAAIALYPFWTANLYTVAFDANGGSVSTTSKLVTFGSTYGTLPTPKRTEVDFTCEFLGWYTAADGGDLVKASTSVLIASDQTLYAHWSLVAIPNSYIVTYMPGSQGEGSQRSATKDKGVALTLPGAIFTREGYTQAGWSTSDGGAKAYDLMASYTTDAEMTLYPYWTRNPISETIDGVEWVYLVRDELSSVAIAGRRNPDTGKMDAAIPTNTTGVLTIPSRLGGCLVTEIGQCAFFKCAGLTQVNIPDSVTSIGEGAFAGCSGLSEVEIPHGVASIGECAFEDCIGLTSMTIPDSVTKIGSYAFNHCASLTMVAIPPSVTSIVQGMFNRCSGLVNVVIPNSVTNIGREAFSSCSSLLSVTIPNSVTSIGEWAFNGCGDLPDVMIPGSVTNIGDYAFDACRGLVRMEIPDSVAYIGCGAFRGCDGLTEAVLPFVGAQRGNAGAPGAMFGWIFGYRWDGDNDSAYLHGSYIPTQLASVTVTDETRIDRRAFYGCAGLKSVAMSDTLTEIGNQAFMRCSGLTSLTIPHGVSLVGDSAFYDCGELAEIYASTTLKSQMRKAVATNVKIYYGDVYVKLMLADGCAGMGKVAGGGAYSVGKNAQLKATPNKGFVFAGWHLGGDLLSKSASYSYKVGSEDVAFAARFVSEAEDAQSLKIAIEDAAAGDGGMVSLDVAAGVESLSAPKLTVSGLPSGTRFDAKTGLVSGKATKPGVYTVTVKATNASVKKAIESTFRLTVPNFKSEAFTAAGLEDKYILAAGVAPDMSAMILAVKSGEWKLKVDGLPAGLKYDDKNNAVVGVATKEGFFTVTFTATKGSGNAAAKEVATATFEVAFPALSIGIAAHGDAVSTDKAKVAGGGKYPVGAKVPLMATPGKGNVFAGWHDAGGKPISGASDHRSASYPYAATSVDTALTAVFATEAEDIASLTIAVSDGSADDDGTYELDLGECVASLSLPKMTVKGLPSGLKFDAKTLKISGKATKPGVYMVKVEATNASVKKAKNATFALTVNNLREADGLLRDPIANAPGERYVVSCGVKDYDLPQLRLSVAGTLKVSGLPTGLKYDAGAGRITGIATKAGTNTVYLTAGKATSTFTVEVAALPDWAVGTFVAYAARPVVLSCGGGAASGCVAEYEYSPCAMTVSGSGAVSFQASYAQEYWRNGKCLGNVVRRSEKGQLERRVGDSFEIVRVTDDEKTEIAIVPVEIGGVVVGRLEGSHKDRRLLSGGADPLFETVCLSGMQDVWKTAKGTALAPLFVQNASSEFVVGNYRLALKHGAGGSASVALYDGTGTKSVATGSFRYVPYELVDGSLKLMMPVALAPKDRYPFMAVLYMSIDSGNGINYGTDLVLERCDRDGQHE